MFPYIYIFIHVPFMWLFLPSGTDSLEFYVVLQPVMRIL